MSTWTCNGQTSITKRLEIDMGHRLLKHEGKCAHAHGHRYAFEITAEPREMDLDAVGRVVDFSVIKSRIGGWLDDNWDHGFICQENDPIAFWLKTNRQKFYVVPFSPTAELLARFVFEKCLELLPPTIRMLNVRCWETPTCHADFGGVFEADSGCKGDPA